MRFLDRKIYSAAARAFSTNPIVFQSLQNRPAAFQRTGMLQHLRGAGLFQACSCRRSVILRACSLATHRLSGGDRAGGVGVGPRRLELPCGWYSGSTMKTAADSIGAVDFGLTASVRGAAGAELQKHVTTSVTQPHTRPDVHANPSTPKTPGDRST